MHDVIEKTNIKGMIYTIRGKEVMLDSDLAKIYGCKNGTKEINQAVKNNLDKFPERYCWKLSNDDSKKLLVKIFDQKNNVEFRGGKYNNPRVFTEQGIYMLATILKTKEATTATLKIMDTFVSMRKLINENKDLFKRILSIENKTSYIENTLSEHETKITEIFDKFGRKEDLKSKLFFNGEIYDAYSLLVDIIEKANKEIIIIDNYVDKVTLDILSKKKINVMVLLITDKNKSNPTKTDIDKFNSEYPSLKVKYTNIFHDRFIILDNKELYHLGASLKDLGKKVFALTKINDKTLITNLNIEISQIK